MFEIGDVTIWNEATNDENQFILDWSSNHGFGLFTFSRRESGHVVCSTECMRHTTVEAVLRTYLDRGGEWPVMVQGYASVDDFMSGVVFVP